ncbi:MAG: flavodoxin domain-containing protein [Candidatus Limnocylindrales bacterium]
MHVLVAYASRHGATQGIAERIAETLQAAGIDAEARPAASVKKLAEYDAFVIGSAAYMFHWLKDAAGFVRRNRGALAAKPVWLFSSGPLGGPTDAQGRDQKVAAIPKDIVELAEAVHARDHRVFFGAYDRAGKPIGFAERFVSLMPAAKEAMPAGDFRDWSEIEAWAGEIARDLGLVSPAEVRPGSTPTR